MQRLLIYWIVPGIVLAAVYLLTKSNNHTTAEDAVQFLVNVNAGYGANLFHPNHLLFSFLGWAVLECCRLFGYSGDAGPIIHTMNALAGALSVVILFNFALKIFKDVAVSITVAGFLAVCYAFWAYTVETDTYILPLPFILIGFWLFLDSYNKDNIIPVFKVSFCLIIATLLHQQHVFTFGAFAIAYFLLARGNLTTRLRQPFALLISGGIATFGAYLIIGITEYDLNGPLDVLSWSRGAASTFPLEPISVLLPIKAAIGLARAIFAADVFFAFDWFNALAIDAFPTSLLVEERFAASQLSAIEITIAIVALTVAALMLSLFLICAVVGSWRSFSARPAAPAVLSREQKAALTLVVSCLGMYGLALALSTPLNPEFWIAVLPIAALLAGFILTALPVSRLRSIAIAFVISLGIGNFAGGILPQTDPKTDFWYMSSRPLFDKLRSGDLLLTAGGYISDTYARYYGGPGVTVISMGARSADEIRQLIESHPSRVLVSSWAFSPLPNILRTRQLGHWDRQAIDKLHTAYKPCLKPFLTLPNQTIWELDRGDCADKR